MDPTARSIEPSPSHQKLDAGSTAGMVAGAQAVLAAAQDAAAAAKAEANRLLDEANAQVEKARDAADAIEIFASIGANVRTISAGEPAPTTTSVVLIQEPLNAAALMIEQTIAAILEDPSIDLEDDRLRPMVSIDSFAQWLSEPGNAERALPAPKCVAAVSSKEIRTVLAVRNGAAVYLIDPEPSLCGVEALFPDPDLHEQMFTDPMTGRPVQPGTIRWDLAERQSARKWRSLYMLAFALEGLVRNTKVLDPLPDGFTFAGGFSDESVELRYGSRNVLAPNIEDLDAWMRRIGGDIQNGGRVIVGDCRHIEAVDGFEGAILPKRYDYFRPPVGVPLGVTQRKGKGLCVSWSEDSSVSAKLTCLLRWRPARGGYEAVNLPVIPIDSDGVTVDVLAKFIGSQQNPEALLRHGHLLAKAITVLQAEEAAEQPFLDAVAAAVASQHGLSDDYARSLTRAHTKRWRRKNAKYRPLASANKSAFDEIARSIGTELAIRSLPVDEDLIEALKAAAGAVWVGRKPNGDYVQVTTDDGVWAHIRTVTVGVRSNRVQLDEWQAPPNVERWLPYWCDSLAWPELRLTDRSRALTPLQKSYVTAAAIDGVLRTSAAERVIAVRVRPANRTVAVHSVADDSERIYTIGMDFTFGGDGSPVLKSNRVASTGSANQEFRRLFGVQRGGIRPLAEGSDVFAYLDREWILAHWPEGTNW